MPLVAVPVGAIFAAILAALLIWATPTLRRFITFIVPNWHVPGFTSLRDAVLNLFDSVTTAVATALDVVVEPLANWIMAPVYVLAGLFGRFNTAISSIRGFISVLVSHYLPAMFGYVGQYAQKLVDGAIAKAQGLYNAAIAYAVGLYHRAVALAQRGIDDSNARIHALAGTIATTVGHALVAAETYAQRGIDDSNARIAAVAGTVGALEKTVAATVSSTAVAALNKTVSALSTEVGNLEKSITTTVSSAVAADVRALTTDVEHVAAAAWPDVIDAVDGAIAAAGTADADIAAALRAIPRAVPASVAGVIAGTLGLSIAATKYLEECGIPNCRNLSSLGRDLQALLGFVEDASFLALFVEMIHNPAGGAHLVQETLGAVADDAIGTAKSLLGV